MNKEKNYYLFNFFTYQNFKAFKILNGFFEIFITSLTLLYLSLVSFKHCTDPSQQGCDGIQ